jgi:hypothetical protein
MARSDGHTSHEHIMVLMVLIKKRTDGHPSDEH